jgi:hypothetical protein
MPWHDKPACYFPLSSPQHIVEPPILLRICKKVRTMAPIRLEYLPQEILSRIATSGSAESVLALSKTCRTLQRACYDILVFKAIIQSQRSLWNDPRTLDIPSLSRYIDSQDTQAWARFALADQRATELREKGRWLSSVLIVKQNEFYLEGFEAWAPHLFVARRKSTPHTGRWSQGRGLSYKTARVLNSGPGLCNQYNKGSILICSRPADADALVSPAHCLQNSSSYIFAFW